MQENRDLEATRQVFYDAWKKAKQGELLTPLEAQVVAVIEVHPEYHVFLEKRQPPSSFPEGNPFLHMGLHLAIREQINTNRPHGIQLIYKTLCQERQSSLEVEHVIMDTLAKILWEAQQTGVEPDESAYLMALNCALK